VLMRRFVTGVLAAVALTTMVAAEQQRASNTQQRPPQKDQAGRGAPGGPPGGLQRAKWWQDDRIKADLRLAPEQSARIEEIFQAALTRMKPVADDLVKREEQLSNLIYGNDVTEAEVLKQAEQVEALRATLGKSRTLMLFRMRRVLSAEQRTKLADIQAQDRERRQGRPPDRGPGER
jgi:Spy/CpxP family protein refolding chaperone